MRAPSSVGVVGLGSQGRALARHFHRLPQTELTWLCDADPARRIVLGGLVPGVAWTTDVADLLADELLDAVVVATPLASRSAVVRRALGAGKHVFVTEPLASSHAEADELVELARSAERHLLVGHEALFHPAVGCLKELIDDGSLGGVLYVHASRWSPGDERRDEDALWGLGPGEISTVLALVGEEPAVVTAHGDAYVLEGVPDVVCCRLELSGGVAAHLHLSWLDPQRVRRLTVVGTDRTAVLDPTRAELGLSLHDLQAVPAGRGRIELRRGDTLSPHLPRADPVLRQCAYFGDLLHSRAGAGPELRHAVAVAATLAALQRSLDRQGLPTPLVDLPTPAAVARVPNQ